MAPDVDASRGHSVCLPFYLGGTPITIQYRLNGALLPGSTVRYNPEADATFPSAAFYCDPMVAGVIIEDSSGTLDLNGWTPFTVEDDACSKPRIFTGWIAGKEISRGRDSNRAGAARVWNCDIVDQNAAASFEVFRSTAASVRPQETDVARVQAAIVSHAMAGTPVIDNGRLSTADPRTLSATNFVTQYPAEMLMSSAGQCGKNVYLYWDESAQEISIHYDAVGAGPAATISFSNVSTDVNETTVFAPLRDARLSQDPYNLYTGVLLGWTGGWSYGRNLELIDELSPTQFSPTNFLRDQVVRSDRIGKAATAASYLETQLEIYGIERETLTFSAILPASKVNLAHAGDVVTVKFSHLPGYTTNTQVAIVRRSVRPVDGHDALYEVTYECANFATERGPGGSGGHFPVQQPCSEGNIQLVNEYHDTEASGVTNVTIPITTPPISGNLLVFHTTMREGPATAGSISGWTLSPLGDTDTPQPTGAHDKSSHAWYYRVADGTETSVSSNWTPNDDEIRGYVAEWSGVGSTIVDSATDDGSDTGDCHCGEVTPGSGQVVLILSAVIYNDGGDSWPYPDPVWSDGAQELEFNIGGGENHPAQCIGYQVTTGTGAGISHLLTVDISPNGDESYAAQTLVFLCSSSGEGIPPMPGSPVEGETPSGTINGTNDDFTTAHSFAAGSLRVLHDGIDQTSNITTSDPEAGTFTLDYAPSTGSTLEVYYLVHP